MLIKQNIVASSIVALIVFFVTHLPSFANTVAIHHQLTVKPNLNNGQLSVYDTINLAKQNTASTFTFQLHKRFTIQTHNDNNKKILKPLKTQAEINTYRVPLRAEQKTLTLFYTGKITSTPQCQFSQQVCALLNKEGIYLSPALAWYPSTTSGLHTFTMTIEQLPEQWRSLSQGQESKRHQWQIDQPQDGIYLVAAAFSVYEKKGAIATAQVYLLNDDAALAQQYLNATEKYLSYYQAQLGAYPYSKFATVESFWESGWGMPSFTLLGSRVMRMPFILYTSFPHEILHNWWGNSVYIDASSGNWSEGLTAYLADHGLKEATGKDIAYRRTALNKYAVFTQNDHDFPITQFRSRHSNATQAVGYSKLLMVYHMLRRQLGDELFFNALKQFYRDYQYQYASMNDLIASLSKTTQRDLTLFFSQWIAQTDAPQLRIKQWQKEEQGDNNLNITLQQYSTQKPFHLSVPVVAFANEKAIWQQTVTLDSHKKTFALKLPQSTERFAIDPFFDLLRKPLAEEIPANLYTFTDPHKKHIVYTDKPSWWADIANVLIKKYPDTLQLALQDNQQTQHKNKTVIKLGDIQKSQNPTLVISPTHYQLNHKTFARRSHSLVFVEQQQQKNLSNIVINIDAPDAKQTQTVLRKLRHYGKYSYLIFNHEGKNVAKGEWKMTQSPLTIDLLK